jgi:hypothetical protein
VKADRRDSQVAVYPDSPDFVRRPPQLESVVVDHLGLFIGLADAIFAKFRRSSTPGDNSVPAKGPFRINRIFVMWIIRFPRHLI